MSGWFSSLKESAATFAAAVSSEVKKASQELMAESPAPDVAATPSSTQLPWEDLNGGDVLEPYREQVRTVILHLSRDLQTFTESADDSLSSTVEDREEFGKNSFEFNRNRVQVAKVLMGLDTLLKQRRYELVRRVSIGKHRTEREFWANYFFHVRAVIAELRTGVVQAGDHPLRQEKVFARVLTRLQSCSEGIDEEAVASSAAVSDFEDHGPPVAGRGEASDQLGKSGTLPKDSASCTSGVASSGTAAATRRSPTNEPDTSIAVSASEQQAGSNGNVELADRDESFMSMDMDMDLAAAVAMTDGNDDSDDLDMESGAGGDDDDDDLG